MMDTQTTSSTRKLTLPVLAQSDKLDQLKADPPLPPDQVDPAVHAAPHANRPPEHGPLEKKIVAALRTICDPEIPVNLYDLGLIYDIDIDPDNNVRIRMTLTAPGCPVAEILPQQVQTKVECIPEVKSADVEIVWEPTWTKDMMSEAARLELGL